MFSKESGSGGGWWQPHALERVACAALEALELGAGAGGACAAGAEAGAEPARKLLCTPAAPQLHARAQCLLRALHHHQYHTYKAS